ncbi:hypothetical protein [Methylobacterium sp. J-077]|uniref:hypothetical protein n=1 Tax=Methylobacterium sp. J-077 TaxID=2836656 RepID=UPI001FB93C12|nr:hypothetical protein [Methylobacterium sp. J-077]MCJ2126389.1 hypothetical protein [Methylobacterium sp. J-077]
MSTATGREAQQAAKPGERDTQRDLYDPHFPVKQRARDTSERTRTDTFDPHFPQRKRH